MRIQMIAHKLTSAMKEYFDVHDMTQREYANLIGIDESTLSHYVTGRREMSYAILSQIAIDMDLDLNYIFKQSYGSTPLNKVQMDFLRLLDEYSIEQQKEIYEAMKVLLKTET